MNVFINPVVEMERQLIINKCSVTLAQATANCHDNVRSKILILIGYTLYNRLHTITNLLIDFIL